jgi:hypothetical protein
VEEAREARPLRMRRMRSAWLSTREETAAMEKGNRGQLQSLAKGLEKDSAGAKTAADRERMRALAGILKAARR